MKLLLLQKPLVSVHPELTEDKEKPRRPSARKRHTREALTQSLGAGSGWTLVSLPVGPLLLALALSCSSALAQAETEQLTKPEPSDKQDDTESDDTTPLDLTPRYTRPPPESWQRAKPAVGPSWSLNFGLGSRGTAGESKHFEGTLGFELGLGVPLWHGFDFGLAAGRFLEEGNHTRMEGVMRAFLLRPQGGPYIGGGVAIEKAVLKPRDGDERNRGINNQDLFATLGLFGGEGLYCEFDFRNSAWRPIAMIFEFGLRFRSELFEPTQAEAQGALVEFRPRRPTSENSDKY